MCSSYAVTMKRYKVPDHYRRGLRQAIGVGIAVFMWVPPFAWCAAALQQPGTLCDM